MALQKQESLEEERGRGVSKTGLLEEPKYLENRHSTLILTGGDLRACVCADIQYEVL